MQNIVFNLLCILTMNWQPIIDNLAEFLNRLTSRKFIGTMLGILIPIWNRVFSWGLTETELALITGTIVAYIVGNIIDSRNSNEGQG